MRSPSTHAVAGPHNLPDVNDLRGYVGVISKARVMEVWRHILANIKLLADLQHRRRHSDPNSPPSASQGRSWSGSTGVAMGARRCPAQPSHHDLCGRMFQRLITDRKFLATFYTLPSSAALLAELAVARLEADWSEPPGNHCAAPSATSPCGTGALLNAAYQAVLSRYRRTGRGRQRDSFGHDGERPCRRRHHAGGDASHGIDPVQRASGRHLRTTPRSSRCLTASSPKAPAGRSQSERWT